MAADTYKSGRHRWAGEVRLLPLAEMVARIELARLMAADPMCPTCGSATPTRPEQKWCPSCQQMLAIVCFPSDRTRSDGRYWVCKACHVVQTRAYRIKVAKAGTGGATGRMGKAS